MSKRSARLVSSAVLACALVLPAPATIVVLPPHSTVAGETIGQWSANWWQYAYPFSVPNDPFTDTSGVNANLNQSGLVFYINQGAAPVVTRSFTVPAGTNLLVSLIAVELSQAELGFDQTDAQIRAATTAQANLIDSLHATWTVCRYPTSSAIARYTRFPVCGCAQQRL